MSVSIFPRASSAPLTLFVPRHKFYQMVTVSLLVAIVIAPTYWDQTLWLGVGVMLTIFIFWHSLHATRRVPWLPGLMVAVACVQWILAPWAAYYLPPVPTQIAMQTTQAEYFGYAVPATLALACGLYLPLRRLGRVNLPRRLGRVDPLVMRRTCDLMMIVGLVVRILIMPLTSGSLRFAALLVAQLAYVGGFASMLMRSPGWRWRIVLLFLVEAALDSAQGIFFELVVWSIYFVLLYMFVKRISRLRLFVIALVGAVALLTLNGIKAGFREELYGAGLTTMESGALAAQHFLAMLEEPRRIVSPENLSFNVTRLNQGAIISRVMYWTPSREPYARGETVVNAVMAAAVPRVLNPDKFTAGGAVNFPRFTGLTLIGQTSINLSVAGELYANFGRWGGVLGMAVTGFLIGLVFRVFVRWSRDSILWWAWVPFVLLSVVSAESGIGEPLNQVVKSAVVMVAVIALVPAWALLRRPLLGRASRLPAVRSAVPPAPRSLG